VQPFGGVELTNPSRKEEGHDRVGRRYFAFVGRDQDDGEPFAYQRWCRRIRDAQIQVWRRV
ncbi:MAG: hypothetical protein AAFQ43_07175, partial [Bacteroidota bacterium]